MPLASLSLPRRRARRLGRTALTNPTAVFGRAVGRGPTRDRVAYLTSMTARTRRHRLDFSTRRGRGACRAFFMVGGHVRRLSDVAARVAAAGHEVGNHTLRHRAPFPRPTRDPRGLRAHARVSSRQRHAAAHLSRAPHGLSQPFVGVATRVSAYVFGWTFGVWDSDRRVSAEESEPACAA